MPCISCKTPGTQFIAWSRFDPRLDSSNQSTQTVPLNSPVSPFRGILYIQVIPNLTTGITSLQTYTWHSTDEVSYFSWIQFLKESNQMAEFSELCCISMSPKCRCGAQCSNFSSLTLCDVHA